MIMRVALENIMPLWPQVAPLLALPLAQTFTHSIEDVRRMLLGGVAHLWVQLSHAGTVEGAMVSEFQCYPQCVVLNAWLAGADEHRMDRHGFTAALKDWGRLNGCTRIRATGRAGWLRAVPGSMVEGLVMSCPVETLQ